MNGPIRLLGKLLSQEITIMFTSAFSDLPDDSQPQEARRFWSTIDFSVTHSELEMPMVPDEDWTLHVPFWNLKKFYQHLQSLGITEEDTVPFRTKVEFYCDAYVSLALKEKILELTC